MPPGARALPILAEPWMEDGAQVGESGQDAPGAAPQPDEGIDPWGRVHLGPARCALALPWREEPVTAASVVGVAIAPITIAVDVGLLPVYALVGAGAGVYRVGELVADSVGE